MILPKSDQEKGSQKASAAPAAKTAAKDIVLSSKPHRAEMSPAQPLPISGTTPTVTPSVQEKSDQQCQGTFATSATDEFAPVVGVKCPEVNSQSSQSENDEPDSKPRADLPSARCSVVCELHVPSDHGSSDSEDDSSVEDYRVVRSIHYHSTSVEQVSMNVPAADSSLPAYCLTCSCMHDPPLSTLPLVSSMGYGASG